MKNKKKTKKQTTTQSSFRILVSKLSFFQKMLLIIGFGILFFAIYPIVILLLIGLLPSLIVLWTDKKNYNKLIVVGFFNISGCMPYIVDILTDFSIQRLMGIFSSVLPWIAMFGSAAVGVLVYYEIPKFFVFVFKSVNNARLKQIENKLKNIANEWGEI